MDTPPPLALGSRSLGGTRRSLPLPTSAFRRWREEPELVPLQAASQAESPWQAGAARANSSRELSPALRVYGGCGLIGLVGGLAEGLIHGGRQLLGQRVSHPDLWVNWHAPWMAPLAMLLLAVALAPLVRLIARLAPRRGLRLGTMALVALAAWSPLTTIPGLHPWAVNVLVLGLAVRLGGVVRFEASGFGRVLRLGYPIALAVWAALFLTLGLPRWLPEATTHAAIATDRPNLLLIVLDTVRAASLSAQGSARPTTPKLDAWAARGVRFAEARSTAPFTLGTHASLFTGLPMSATSARVNTPLDASPPTLAEHLRQRGYATAGFVGNIFYGSAHYGLDRGFQVYQDIPGNITRRVTPREFVRSCGLGASLLTWCERKWRILAPMQRLRFDADAINREALAWLDGPIAREQPFFLFLNYFDAHAPYSLPGEAPQPWSRLAADRLEKRLNQLKQAEAAIRPGSPESPELIALRQAVHAEVRDAYDDGIAWIDSRVDALLRDLDRRGILDQTLIVITSDHGEMLGEHDQLGHGLSLNRPVVHVPLILFGSPGLGLPAGQVVTEPVSLRDVPRTLLGLIGDSRADRFPGVSLSRCWNPDEARSRIPAPVLTEVEHMPWMPRSERSPVAFGPMWLLTEGRWHYIRQQHQELGLVEQLYDRETDPGEEHDLAHDPLYRDTLLLLRERFAAADTGRLAPLAATTAAPPPDDPTH